jgi:hypothetical protein
MKLSELSKFNSDGQARWLSIARSLTRLWIAELKESPNDKAS